MDKNIKKHIFLKDIVMINVFVTVFLSTIISLSITKWKFYLKLESNIQSIPSQTDYVGNDTQDQELSNVIQNTDTKYIIYKPSVSTNCVTPRWVEIQDGESVIAYQQRDDVNALCDVQRRNCAQGKLSWTFKQKSCREHIVYEYVKQVPTCYNCKPDNPYIQPDELAPNRRWNFNTDGKINEPQPVKIYRDNSIDSSYIGEYTEVWQEPATYIDCTTPRWASVKDWFFVKAYRSSDGYINSPCLLEVRYCTNWSLWWQYTNESCEYHDLTYESYVQNGSRNLRQRFINRVR